MTILLLYYWPMNNSTQARTGRHVVFNLHAHLVFVTKYRKTVFTQAMLQRMQQIFLDICECFETALVGYLIGGLCVLGMRIFGTLGFGKEAMGMGDVHIMAAVGAVTGWMIPTVAFFLAPIFGLLWAVYLLIRKNQHELPYGPWLSAASLAAMIFNDKIAAYFRNLGH